MRPSSGPEWFVVHTRSRSEKAVATHLARRGIETFLPTVTRRRRWQDRYKDVETALFPGYCFTHISAAERHKVLNCQNVVRILTFNGEPVPVRVEEIESFRMLVSSQLSCEPCPALRQGDRVVVNRGPLKGAVGHFVRRGRRSRLELCVTAIGQAVSVEVDRGDVERC